MKTPLYAALQRKIIGIILVVSFAPLVLLGATIYLQFAALYKEKIEEQIRYRAAAQAEAVDLFLKERTAILGAMADTHSFDALVDTKVLGEKFAVMNARAGAFVDLGVIDHEGQHRAYVGPYALAGLNYADQPWFDEVVLKGLFISDVYMGFRKSPHFIIAVRRQEGERTWILRATIDPDVFGRIVQAAQVGRTGDAYIVSRERKLQTKARYGGEILADAALDPTDFGVGTTVLEMPAGSGNRVLHAGTWLKEKDWLLVISQDAGEEMAALFAARNVEIAIIVTGVVAIVLTTVLTTRMAINRLRSSDERMTALNAQLVQADKLAALGKMAAGVAHEINNPLAVILQKTGWIQDLLREEDMKSSRNLGEFQAAVKKIEDHVERARKVVHGMLGYARRMEPVVESVDVNETVRQTVALLDNYARIHNIEIRTDLAQDMPVIASDQARLQQVFLNIISNAIDAIEKDGLVRVESRRDDSQIVVSVADNGPGISPERQKKVFDPFYSTKGAGKGTGLGLWISYNIVASMDGTITVASEPGKGATFTVKIPIRVPEKR